MLMPYPDFGFVFVSRRTPSSRAIVKQDAAAGDVLIVFSLHVELPKEGL